MANLARTGWTVTVDTNQYLAANMLDGNLGTAWRSEVGYPHWFILDLGSPQTFDTILYGTNGSGEAPTSVQVYVSDDGVTWGSPIASMAWSGNADHVANLPRQTKRYVKLLGVSSTQATRMACAELNLSVEQGYSRYGWSATATSSYDAATSPDKALDGLSAADNTNWISDAGMPQSITIDMGVAQSINYIRCTKASTNFSLPLVWGQNLPLRLTAYTSLNGTDWTEAGEAVWPAFGSNHWIYFTAVTARYFRLEAAFCDGYNRFALAEIYAGLLAEGDACKRYWKAHPQTIEDLTPIIGGADQNGIVDFATLYLDVDSPEDLQLARVLAYLRVWRTRGIASYPEFCCSNWDLPEGWDSLTLESLTILVEGTHLNGTGIDTYAVFTLLDRRDSSQSIFDFLVAWVSVLENFAPEKRLLLYSSSAGWVEGLTAGDIEGMYSNLDEESSTSQDAIDHSVGNTSNLNVLDHYLLLAWEGTYVTPPGGGDDEEPPPEVLPGRNDAMLLIDLSEIGALPTYGDAGPLPRYD